MKRLKILAILDAMPEQSFAWFLENIKFSPVLNTIEPQYRDSIDKLKKACYEYGERMEKKK